MSPKLRVLRLATRLESLAIEMRRDDEASTAGYRVEITAVLHELSALMGDLD